MSNADGTYECAHEGCSCRVADTEMHPRNDQGEIFCSESCRDGSGCQHPGCTCGSEH